MVQQPFCMWKMLLVQSVIAWGRFYGFCKRHYRRICTLLHAQKSTRKAPATFEAREAAGCGSLRLLRALGGTRILQAAAPTAPPCFCRRQRSSPLQTRGCSPLIIPKQLGSIQKIQVASLKDFLCSADWKPLSRCATAPPSGSKRTRKRYGLPGNFAVLPRALHLGELASPSGLD